MKTEYHHIPPEIIREVAEVLTEGAHKTDPTSGKTYTSRGWRLMHAEDPEKTRNIYSDALSRHLIARACGEVLAPDSGKPHLVHALANIIILRDLERLDEANTSKRCEGFGGTGKPAKPFGRSIPGWL